MAGLAEYHRKRDFTKTAEPAGKVEKGGGNRFIDTQRRIAGRNTDAEFREQILGRLFVDVHRGLSLARRGVPGRIRSARAPCNAFRARPPRAPQ